MNERKPVLNREQVDEAYRWADVFMRDHMRYPCPQCNEADLESFGAKMRCPECGYIQPCCDPQE